MRLAGGRDAAGNKRGHTGASDGVHSNRTPRLARGPYGGWLGEGGPRCFPPPRYTGGLLRI
jgi:hypothetical protein